MNINFTRGTKETIAMLDDNGSTVGKQVDKTVDRLAYRSNYRLFDTIEKGDVPKLTEIIQSLLDPDKFDVSLVIKPVHGSTQVKIIRCFSVLEKS